MKTIRGFINESIFDDQDNFLNKMIDMWKSDKRLKPFDTYFKWKTKELDTNEFKKDFDAIKKMRFAADELIDKLIDWNDSSKNEEIISVLDAISSELLNIEIMHKNGII